METRQSSVLRRVRYRLTRSSSPDAHIPAPTLLLEILTLLMVVTISLITTTSLVVTLSIAGTIMPLCTPNPETSGCLGQEPETCRTGWTEELVLRFALSLDDFTVREAQLLVPLVADTLEAPSQGV